MLNHKSFHHLSAVIFAYVFLLHSIRALKGWDMVVGDIMIPMWFSWIAIVLSAYMTWMSFRMESAH